MGDEGGIELSDAAAERTDGESPAATAAIAVVVPAEDVGIDAPAVAAALPADAGKLMLPPKLRLCAASGSAV